MPRPRRSTDLTHQLQDLGLKLFALRYSPDRFLEGNAIVPAERLPDMVSVDAPVGAFYSVTRQQQILLGYLVLPKAWFALILAIGVLAYHARNPVWFALFAPLALLASTFGIWSWKQILAIREQPFRQEAAVGEKSKSRH